MARRLFLTGERISATLALGYGLVDVVTAATGLDQSVEQVAENLLRGGPRALAEVKRLIDELAGVDLEVALDVTAERIARLRSSPEAREGMSAFLEKRPARWVPKRRG